MRSPRRSVIGYQAWKASSICAALGPRPHRQRRSTPELVRIRRAFSAPALLRTARLSRDAHPGLAIKASPGTARSRLGPGRYRALGLVSPRFTCRWIGVLGRLSKHLRCSPSDDEVVAIHV